MKRTILSITGLLALGSLYSQCTTETVSGNLTFPADTTISGIYNVGGTFYIPAGVTVYVKSFGTDSCGKLEVHAKNIRIEGTINGDYSGYPGGNPGLGATLVTSITGDESALTGCHNKDDAGQISVGGGGAGFIGEGPGGGLFGAPGSVGSGPKQQCGNVGDDYGMVGGSGGAGAGGGGSYGGDGSTGGNGGNGSDSHTGNNVSISPAYSVLAGIGGTGGSGGLSYGTNNGTDIDLGSGGGGSGGGGRSFYEGQTGGRGGNGGGAVQLIAVDSLVITGTISVNGENGLAGGNGGNGDQSPDCCGDGCNDCGERTVSAGAGGGGGSGAGSGGGILLKSDYFAQITGQLSAKGGEGGGIGTKGNGSGCSYGGNWACSSDGVTTGSGFDGAPGGSGGGGRIKLFVTDCSTNQVTPTHDEAGGTNAVIGTYSLVTVNCPQFAGIDELQNGIEFNVYPNPTVDIVTVQVSTFMMGNQQSELVVVDQMGRTIYSKPVNFTTQQSHSIDFGKFASGIYTVGFKNSNLFSVKRVVKL